MFKKILLPVDLSTETTTKNLCEAANLLAEKHDSEVLLITIIPDYGTPLVASFFPQDAQLKIKKEMSNQLKKLADQYFSVPISTYLTQGKRVQSVLKMIDSHKPDLVVMGCRRKKTAKNQRLLGATGIAISGRANCSVMIIR